MNATIAADKYSCITGKPPVEAPRVDATRRRGHSVGA